MFELPYLLHNGTSRPQKEPYGVTCIWLYSRRNRGGYFGWFLPRKTAVWPMEYIKTQLQLQGKMSGSQKPPFNGMISGLSYTVQTHGFLGLYKGLGVTLLFSVPKAGIRFGGNAYFKEKLADGEGKLTMTKQFMAGVGAGCVEATLAVTPMESIKTKLIQHNMSLVTGVKTIVRESGIGGLYQGLFATILKQSSNQGLRFMFFNKYKDTVEELVHASATKGAAFPLSMIAKEDGALTPIGALLGGMSAGCFSTMGNNPFDVVKTRMQGTDAHKYKSTLDCAMRIMTEEGPAAYYKGCLPRLGRVVPGQGIIFMSMNSIQGIVQKAFFS